MKKTLATIILVLSVLLVGCTSTKVEQLPEIKEQLFVLWEEERLDGSIIKKLKYEEQLLHIEDGEYYYVTYYTPEYNLLSPNFSSGGYHISRRSNEIIKDRIGNSDKLSYLWRYRDNIKNEYYNELQKVDAAYKNMQNFENNYNEMCEGFYKEYCEDIQSLKSSVDSREYNPKKRLTEEEQNTLEQEYRKLYQELYNACQYFMYEVDNIETNYRRYKVIQ